MRITGLYAALLTLLILGLAVRVMLIRRRTRIGLGDGGDRSVACAIRAHGNAVEHVGAGEGDEAGGLTAPATVATPARVAA